jgi:hypothetical protein
MVNLFELDLLSLVVKPDVAPTGADRTTVVPGLSNSINLSTASVHFFGTYLSDCFRLTQKKPFSNQSLTRQQNNYFTCSRGFKRRTIRSQLTNWLMSHPASL